MLPKAPLSLPDIEQHLRHAMDAWMDDKQRPRLDSTVEKQWDGYVEQWINTPTLPLFVRVGKGEGFEKGCSTIRHDRMLIRCDNSPAQWIFRRAFESPDLTFADLTTAWERRKIPVAMVVTTAARKNPQFIGLPRLGRNGIGNELGWELSHRREVRLAGKLDTATLEAFEQHFRLLMSVGNMVLTPSRMGMNHLVDWYFRKDAMGSVIRFDDKLPQIAEICRRHGVRELLLFGSALGPDFRPDSDFDFLVEFLPETKIGLFEYAGMGRELEELLQTKVDLVSKSGLKPRIRESVLSRTENIYTA